jgi:hypothetical protein
MTSPSEGEKKMKFRKKPVVIEAVKLTEPMKVFTLEGEMHGNIGDWMITGVKGETYFCKPDIFEMTYEAVE